LSPASCVSPSSEPAATSLIQPSHRISPIAGNLLASAAVIGSRYREMIKNPTPRSRLARLQGCVCNISSRRRSAFRARARLRGPPFSRDAFLFCLPFFRNTAMVRRLMGPSSSRLARSPVARRPRGPAEFNQGPPPGAGGGALARNLRRSQGAAFATHRCERLRLFPSHTNPARFRLPSSRRRYRCCNKTLSRGPRHAPHPGMSRTKFFFSIMLRTGGRTPFRLAHSSVSSAQCSCCTGGHRPALTARGNRGPAYPMTA